MANEESAGSRLRLQTSIYMCGMFSNSMSNLIAVILPLWLVAQKPSAIVIGIVLGCRTFLPLLLAIHGGSLIDKVGARRVMLWAGILLASVTLLYPTASWLPFIMAVQMISGLAATMAWIGAQTLIGQRLKGDATYAGRLAFCNRLAAFAGPPLAGAIWDFAGPWAAFSFVAFWGLGVVVGALLLPHRSQPRARVRQTVRMATLLPHISDYTSAFRLMAIPAVLLVVMVSILRVAGEAINSSFYVVYLGGIGYTGTAIGFLVSAFAVPSAFSALLAGFFARYCNPYWLVLFAVSASVILVSITPLLGSYILLMIAMIMRGSVSGLVQPIMLSILSKATDATEQGRAVGLRATANRLGTTFTPVFMGAVAELTGIENAFYVLGVILVVLLIAVAYYVRRTPGFADNAPA